MKSCKKTSIVINTSKLDCRTRYNLSIILKSKKRVIIKGIVYNSKKQPSVGAAIEIIQVDCQSKFKEILGYSYTNNNGEYLFSIEVLPNKSYEIAIYSPLNI